MKNEIRRESLEITVNETLWHINVISYEGEDSPYRIIKNDREIFIINNKSYVSCVIKHNKTVDIISEDLNIKFMIKDNFIIVYNYM
ncbi:MAG: hypothetical protein ACRCZK_02420 [Oscillospiraceae bacterium]